MKKIFSIILASVALSSCVDTVILPENKTLDEDFWQKKNEVEAVVATAYAQLRDGATAAGTTSFQRNAIVWGSFRSDEMVVSSDFKSINAVTTGLSEIHSMNMNPTNMFTQWYPLYSCINYCNLVLEKGEEVMKIDPNYTIGDWQANKAQVTALKALCYFYLVRVFRDVPVTPHAYVNSSDNFLEPQKAPAEVLEICINDLKSVLDGAPNTNAYGDSRDRGLFNKDGINALLADIYLWRASVNHSAEDYQNAVECCDKVIAAKKAAHSFRGFGGQDKEEKDYYLAAYNEYYDDIWGLGAGFNSNGQNAEESIFEIQYKENGITNTALSQMYYGYNAYTSGYGYVKATNIYGDYSGSGTTPNVFKNTVDQRLFDFTYGANSGTEQHAIRKFVAKSKANDATASNFSTERRDFSQNWIIYRLTDVMLMKAEALVQLADGDEEKLKEAFDIVKFVNDRALTNTSGAQNFNANKDKMEEFVLMERARELCFEGKRWFDLMRYNYRHINGVQYDKTMAEISDDPSAFPANSAEFFEIAHAKYTSKSAMKAKTPTEIYLYMPINEEEVKINTALHHNPAFPSTKNKK